MAFFCCARKRVFRGTSSFLNEGQKMFLDFFILFFLNRLRFSTESNTTVDITNCQPVKKKKKMYFDIQRRNKIATYFLTKLFGGGGGREAVSGVAIPSVLNCTYVILYCSLGEPCRREYRGSMLQSVHEFRLLGFVVAVGVLVCRQLPSISS